MCGCMCVGVCVLCMSFDCFQFPVTYSIQGHEYEKDLIPYLEANTVKLLQKVPCICRVIVPSNFNSIMLHLTIYLYHGRILSFMTYNGNIKQTIIVQTSI